MNPVNNNQILNSLHSIGKHSNSEAKSFTKLSTGKKITQPSDDVVNSAKAAQLNKAIKALDAVDQNVNYAANTLDTASGGLSQTLGKLQDLREMAIRGADDSLSMSERRTLNTQSQDSISEINRLSQSVKMDGENLLDGSQTNKTVAVGDAAGDTKTYSIESASAQSLGVDGVDLSSADSSVASIDALDAAIKDVSSRMSKMGGESNTLTEAASHNRETSNNLSQSRSVMEDLDFALAIGEIKAIQIKKQSATQTLAALLQSSQQAAKLL